MDVGLRALPPRSFLTVILCPQLSFLETSLQQGPTLWPTHWAPLTAKN